MRDRRVVAAAGRMAQIAAMRACLIFVVALAAALLTAAPGGAEGGRLDTATAHAMSLAGDLTIIDVRTPAEWRTDGIPEGAAAVSLNGPGGRQAFLEGVLALVDGDRDRPLAMICRTGVRSSAARVFLRGQGFTRVYDISNGMHGRGADRGWLAEGLPVDPCERC